MFRRLSIANAIIFAVMIFTFSAYLTEARLGQGEKRQLAPISSLSASKIDDVQRRNTNTNTIDETPQANSRQNEEAAANEECKTPCPNGSSSSIAVCHQRGRRRVQICTEAEAFAEHKQRGDTCGICPTEL